MPASLPAVDRPIPTVAIVGTDAVLAAAPATPVQIAHACLRRGFTVAVPASWGDELVAAETMRQLATRERGPAVMCVCPFARARLLGPGADLAPFLVSLVSPPVAVARYLRAAYGEHGVHITYIGTCPGADDPSIDERLTPDVFMADLAERDIALSEQPLVFDSIVPPDRRRWGSLPGGVPNPDVLSGETDGRAFIEIERDDVTTELAQHIIAREHVLLDLAPSLGCACSGAVGLVSPDRARAVVAAAEPPRALGPVIDPTAVVSLDVPVFKLPVAVARSTPVVVSTTGFTPAIKMELVLDELLGAGHEDDTEHPSGEIIVANAVIVDLPQLPPVPVAHVDDATPTVRRSDDIDDTDENPAPADRDHRIRPTADSEIDPVARAAIESPVNAESDVEVSEPATVVEAYDVFVLGSPATPAADSGPGSSIVESEPSGPALDEPIERIGAEESTGGTPHSPVRKRTPPAMLRYPGSSVPKATVANGRPLPRAYVAKRRTPPAGATAISSTAPGSVTTPRSNPDPTPSIVDSAPSPGEPASRPTAGTPNATSAVALEPVSVASPPAVIPLPAAPAESESSVGAAVDPVVAPRVAPSDAQPSVPAPTAVPAAPTAAIESNTRDGRTTTRSANHPALVFVLVTALVALAVFVLLTLRR